MFAAPGMPLTTAGIGRRHAVTCLGLFAVALLGPAAVTGPAAPVPAALRSIIVRVQAGTDPSSIESRIGALGGHLRADLEIIHGFSAAVPGASVEALRSLPGVASVGADASVHLSGSDGYIPTERPGSLYTTTLTTGAQAFWRNGWTGAGVGVALIDSGVVPVAGLDAAGKVVEGPDLSSDAASPRLDHLDAFGHGTHMAGIIAGHDAGAAPQLGAGDGTQFLGMAPDAHLVNVKVADSQGVSDVSQVIAAIGWVVRHRDDPGLGIRVLNLSFATDSTQPYAIDPLAAAAEAAWHSGIVVVAAAGNEGNTSPGLADPADDPYLIAVGAIDSRGTLSTRHHTVAGFSNAGSAERAPDLVAPGVHIASLRDPGSALDLLHHSTAKVGSRFFKGSGTSQAAAVVSGAAALLLSQRPGATPDQVKALLTGAAAPLKEGSPLVQGAGALRLQALIDAPTPQVRQSWPVSTGSGSLDLSRGSLHLPDPAGSGWSGSGWSGSGWSGSGWSGSGWSGSGWSGSGWSGSGWSSAGWD